MKRYIANRSPVQRRLDGKQISHFDAGKDFLSTVLLFAASELNLGDEEVAFTVPVEAFEHYENWLTDVAEAAGIRRFRLIDEPSAAALGYGAHIQPGDVYLIFDFGGDPSGAARLTSVSPDEGERRAQFWMNESSPTFLTAEPPASQGEARFQVEFSIDGNKRLLMTARDVKTGRVTHRSYPVVKLT